MKKVLFSTLCLLVWQVASAQMPTVEEILKEQKEKKNRVNER
ncbi:MAG: hypothetical protein ACI9JY_001552, partial [Saprospiraceae bacterium]